MTSQDYVILLPCGKKSHLPYGDINSVLCGSVLIKASTKLWSALVVLLAVQQEMSRRLEKQVYSSIGFCREKISECCGSTQEIFSTQCLYSDL